MTIRNTDEISRSNDPSKLAQMLIHSFAGGRGASESLIRARKTGVLARFSAAEVVYVGVDPPNWVVHVLER